MWPYTDDPVKYHTYLHQVCKLAIDTFLKIMKWPVHENLIRHRLVHVFVSLVPATSIGALLFTRFVMFTSYKDEGNVCVTFVVTPVNPVDVIHIFV